MTATKKAPAKAKPAAKPAAPKTIKMIRNGDTKEVRSDLVEHFAECGWKQV